MLSTLVGHTKPCVQHALTVVCYMYDYLPPWLKHNDDCQASQVNDLRSDALMLNAKYAECN